MDTQIFTCMVSCASDDQINKFGFPISVYMCPCKLTPVKKMLPVPVSQTMKKKYS